MPTPLHTLLWKTVGIQQMHAYSSARVCSIGESTKIILPSPAQSSALEPTGIADSLSLALGVIRPL